MVTKQVEIIEEEIIDIKKQSDKVYDYESDIVLLTAKSFTENLTVKESKRLNKLHEWYIQGNNTGAANE